MLCNNQNFLNEFNTILNSGYGKYLPENFEIYGYIEDNKTEIDINNHLIHIDSSGDLIYTFNKTQKCLQLIKHTFNFDYIIKTNTSTVLNIQIIEYLLNNGILKNDCLYGSDMYVLPSENQQLIFNSYIEKDIPVGLLYLRGNCLIFSKTILDIICNFNYKYDTGIDDSVIGFIIYSHFGKKYKNHIFALPQAWYDCEDKTKIINTSYYGNGLCEWSNKNIDFNFLNKFICVQIKSYADNNRITIPNKIDLISNIFYFNKINNYQEIINIINKYMNNYIYLFVNWISGYVKILK